MKIAKIRGLRKRLRQSSLSTYLAASSTAQVDARPIGERLELEDRQGFLNNVGYFVLGYSFELSVYGELLRGRQQVIDGIPLRAIADVMIELPK